MSTGATSSSRRLGVRTYGRTKESTSSRAFDDAVTPKPTPIKAASTHTKWGKTNFIALRESQRLKGEVLEGSRKVKHTKNIGDPFSFDEDASKRNSPVKKQSNANVMASTRLPGTRIMTRSAEVKKDVKVIENVGDGIVEYDDDEEVSFNFESKVSKTYSRTPFSNKPEPKKQNTEPKSKESVKNFGFGDLSDEEESQRSDVCPKNRAVEHSKKQQQCDSHSKVTDDNSDDDIFPVQFMKKPQKTYGSRYSSFDTSSSSSSFTSSPVVETVDVFDDISHKPSTSKSPRKRMSKYSDPVLLEQYKKQYALSKGLTGDALYKLDNSVVISKAEILSEDQKGKTVIVVCKPKVSGNKEKKDVQSKYFRMSQDFNQIRSNLIDDVVHEISDVANESEADVPMDGNDTEKNQSQKDSVKSTGCKNNASNAKTNKLSSHRNKQCANSSPRNYSSVSSSQKKTNHSKNSQDSVESVPSSSQESSNTPNQEAPVLEKVVTLRTDSDSYASDDKRMLNSGGGKRYKIFKSRGPAKPQYIEYALPEDSTPDSPEPPVLSPACESTPVELSEQSEEPMELSVSEKIASESEVDDSEIVEDVVPLKRQKVESEGDGDSQENRSAGSVCSREDSPSSFSGSQQSEPEAPKSRRFFKSKSSKNSLSGSDLRRQVLQSPGKVSVVIILIIETAVQGALKIIS